MVKYNNGVQTQSKKKNTHQGKQLNSTTLFSYSVDLAEQANNWPLNYRGIFTENKATPLGNERLPEVQRWTLATHIGRIQGNQYLQRLIANRVENSESYESSPSLMSHLQEGTNKGQREGQIPYQRDILLKSNQQSRSITNQDETKGSFQDSVQLQRSNGRYVRQFPEFSPVRPDSGVIYLFVAVTSPEDIKANNIAAAETGRNAIRTNRAIFLPKVDLAIVEHVATIEELISLFNNTNENCQQGNLRVRQIEVFSHGGRDGPGFGSGQNQQQFGLNGAPPVSALPRLPYTEDAVVFFRGCRIGRGNFLQTFASLQGVATYGFEGNTAFSSRPRHFYAWEQGTPAYQLEFPGWVRTNKFFGLHPQATPPRGYIPHRRASVQREQYFKEVSSETNSNGNGRAVIPAGDSATREDSNFTIQRQDMAFTVEEIDELERNSARVILPAVEDILTRMSIQEVMQRRPTIPDQPIHYRNALWDFSKAVQGIGVRGEQRQFWLNAGLRRIEPLIDFVEREAPEAGVTVRSRIEEYANQIREQAVSEGATSENTREPDMTFTLEEVEGFGASDRSEEQIPENNAGATATIPQIIQSRRVLINAINYNRTHAPSFNPMWVKRLQEVLGVPTDARIAIFNPETVQLIAQFQQTQFGGVNRDTLGRVDEQTLRALQERYPTLADRQIPVNAPNATTIEAPDPAQYPKHARLIKQAQTNRRPRFEQAFNELQNDPETRLSNFPYEGDNPWQDFLAQMASLDFLGLRVVGHPLFLQRLHVAILYLRGQFPGKSDEQIRSKVKLDLSRNTNPGDSLLRAGQSTSFHTFGFAFDINISRNPWVGGQEARNRKDQAEVQRKFEQNRASIQAIWHAVWLTGKGAPIWPQDSLERAQVSTTAELWQHFHEASTALTEYFGFRNDPSKLNKCLEQFHGRQLPTHPPEGLRLTDTEVETLRQANASTWLEIINRDWETTHSGHDATSNWGQRRELGFMNLELVLAQALRDAAGLAWGACDIEGSSSGDFMHFDGRTIPQVRELKEKIKNYRPQSQQNRRHRS